MYKWSSTKLSAIELGEILEVSQSPIRTSPAEGKIRMHRNPANGYRLFRRDELEKFLKKVAKPVVPSSRK